MKYKIYAIAVTVWLVYSLVGKAVFVTGSVWPDSATGYILVSAYAVLFSVVFLYLFSHEDLFRFARIIEKRERHNDKKWLVNLVSAGKFTGTTIAGVMGGPVLGALAVKIFYGQKTYKYWLVAMIGFVNGLFWLSLVRG